MLRRLSSDGGGRDCGSCGGGAGLCGAGRGDLSGARNFVDRGRNYGGMGRTGKPFAVEHWDVAPDMILVGKGIASGYAPLGAVLVAPHVVEAFERGSGAFQHGFTYQAHPVATAGRGMRCWILLRRVRYLSA